jgi:FtsZ-interacting cell division protein ZipA
MRFLLCIFVLLIVVAVLTNGQKYSQRKRRSKEIEDRISKLDEATKKRIHAMKASGMPKEAIAEKIAYVAGGKNVAKRIVDALHDEPEAKDAKRKKPNPTTKQQPPTATKSKPPQPQKPGSPRRDL